MHVDSQNLRVIPYKDSDHPEVAQFYLGNGWKVPPAAEILPDLGFLVIDESTGQKLAVGFLYETNSVLYLLEWTATNPAAPLKIRAKAFKLLVRTIQGLVKLKKPDGQIIQFTPNESIVRAYKRLGFVDTERATLLHWK
jgi:hypothetical protein